MKLVSFGPTREERPGIVLGKQVLDLGIVRPDWPATWRGILDANLLGEAQAVAKAPEGSFPAGSLLPLSEVRLGPPIPNPSKIIAIGLNYRDHAEEQNRQPPESPLLFAKAPTSLIGPKDTIVLPPRQVEARPDAEAELCVVIGRRAKNVEVEEALDAIVGYTIMNDVSGRQSQYSDRQWFRGKSFDTFGPCGPWIVTTDELPDPSQLTVEADWDEVSMQRGNTRDLIFGVKELVSYVSRQMTLVPGDLISTGTPAGVGVFRDPPVFLQSGSKIEIRIGEIGALLNPVL